MTTSNDVNTPIQVIGWNTPISTVWGRETIEEYELSLADKVIKVLFFPVNRILQILGVDLQDGPPAGVIAALQKAREGVNSITPDHGIKGMQSSVGAGGSMNTSVSGTSPNILTAVNDNHADSIKKIA